MQLDFALSRQRLRALQAGAVMVAERPALFEITGPGAVDCLQGLLTSDVSAAGPDSLSYGAMLTSKGMIILDPFVLRAGDTVTLLLASFARERALAHFARVLPPRLARVRDRTGEWEVRWLLGAGALGLLRQHGVAVPESGRVARGEESGHPILIGRASPVMPFVALLLGETDPIGRLAERLDRSGTASGDEATLATARVLAGWPSLGREIDEKTLPQEVRYDELGAVSYSKGCYTGQETVARVHFRGHPNRYLRALTMPPTPTFPDRRISAAGREVGVLRTTVMLEDRTLALATLRREVPENAVLSIDAREARILPFPVVEVAV